MTSQARKPDPDTIAGFIKIQRAILQWKQATLASKAGLSLSTIQRVERGDPIADESLNLIALALNHPQGAFTSPRIPMAEDEAIERLVESLAWMKDRVEVSVAPLQREAQMRELASCHMQVIDSDLGDVMADDLAEIREWFDLLGFIRCQDGTFMPKRQREVSLRGFYKNVLAAVRSVEKRHKAICLVGNYLALPNTSGFEKVRVAVVAFRSREHNPACAKISSLWCHETIDARSAFADWQE